MVELGLGPRTREQSTARAGSPGSPRPCLRRRRRPAAPRRESVDARHRTARRSLAASASPAGGNIFLNAGATRTSSSGRTMPSSHATATTAAPSAVGTRLMYGAPPPSLRPTCPGALPPAPGSRWPHVGRDDCPPGRRGPSPFLDAVGALASAARRRRTGGARHGRVRFRLNRPSTFRARLPALSGCSRSRGSSERLMGLCSSARWSARGTAWRRPSPRRACSSRPSSSKP